MYTLMVIVFILGYAAIVFEHPLKINKAAPALLTGVLLWTVFILGTPNADFFEYEGFKEFSVEARELASSIGQSITDHEIYSEYVGEQLAHHLSEIAEILFFLMGAMTIVELIDIHQGFKVITNRIKTRSSRKLIWVMSLLAFFMSAILDNLTTSIVMVSLLRKLVHNPSQRRFFAGILIIAANAGGAWSPIGDVTTTMLWIGGQVTTGNIILQLIIPSMVCLLVPLLILSFQMKGEVERAEYDYKQAEDMERFKGSRRMLAVGVGGLVFVPIFKTFTHLPPYMGMLLSLGVVWITSELIHIDKTEEEKKPYSAIHALEKIDTASVLFFFGILAAIGALQATHVLEGLALWMNDTIGNLDAIVLSIGVASAIIDNVPLVAAAMGMYDLIQFPTDAKLWEFLAYCAGTGGSILIIGSAAGVAVMGMEKIDFVWYLKKISLLALVGYLAGAGAYLGIYYLTHG
ncbi:Na+/H+ antiporter NhaD [Catalinimonas alkaloidigena]|uniref:Na+/H+ antiporter NhaD n=1 Tax=Catalinimonas alkaloidigena TaxID=1075417 RepID=A0A1G9NYK2_9BACT|nr:sodium:proton antiporter NhaD [Catalinimonas alkaloidigena]SDL91055.1 Na+/H+ antiporter NhaD [Catalinimonas alkaloidigena]